MANVPAAVIRVEDIDLFAPPPNPANFKFVGRILDPATGQGIDNGALSTNNLKTVFTPNFLPNPIPFDLSQPGQPIPGNLYGNFVNDQNGERYYIDGNGVYSQVGGGAASALGGPTVTIGDATTTRIEFYNGAYHLPSTHPAPTANFVLEYDHGIPKWVNSDDLRGISVVGRTSDLGNLDLFDGNIALVHMTLQGNVWDQVFVYDENRAKWMPVGSKNFLTDGTNPDPDQADNGDLLLNTATHSLRYYQNGQWEDFLSEAAIRGWIAASGLFQGTVSDTASQGAILPNSLPTPAATNRGQYWTAAKDFLITGTGTGLDGIQLRTGDWLQSIGDPTQGLDGWAVISGDLLSKARADRLYGLYNWQANTDYEMGAVVDYGNKLWRSNAAVTAGSPESQVAPGTPVTGFPAETGTMDIIGTRVRDVQQPADLQPPPAPAGVMNRKMFYAVVRPFTIPAGFPDVANTPVDQGDMIYSDGTAWKIEPRVMAGTNAWETTQITIPAVAGNQITPPWDNIPLSAVIPTVTMGTRPATDQTNSVFLVLDDPRANGHASLQRYDVGTQNWEILGGGGGAAGNPLKLTGGDRVYPDVVEVINTQPTREFKGRIWFNPDTLKVSIHDGNAWVEIN